MTSSVHNLAENGEAEDQQKLTESQTQSSSLANGHPGISSTMHYAAPAQIGVGNVMAQTAYPYPDPYYRSIFAPHEAQSYPAQPYPSQPMVHLQLMGIQQGGVPLPSGTVEEPVFVNAKQYHGIMRRRQSKAESENKLVKSRKPYLHESRHLHALKRNRGTGGRFQKKSENQQNKGESSDKSKNRNNRHRNCEKGSP